MRKQLLRKENKKNNFFLRLFENQCGKRSQTLLMAQNSHRESDLKSRVFKTGEK